MFDSANTIGTMVVQEVQLCMVNYLQLKICKLFTKARKTAYTR